jgi:predicted AlkP superfamily phosphohydrolase/phosphomutase
VAAELIRRQPSNLTLVYLNGIDWISHWFWGFRDDAAQPIAFDPGGEQTRLFANLVDAYYVYTDHLVSTLVEAAGSPTDVVVLSDHGFRDLRVPEDAHLEINVLLADLGYLRFARGGEVDYAGTRAFNFSDVKLDERSIYLNLVGREAEGIVPLEEKDEITTRLVGALRGLQVLSGEPLFASVRINDTREVALPQIPDIEVRINPRVGASDLLKLQGREVPIQLYLKASPLVIGEHRKQGILVVAGPSFQPGAVHGATVLDVTPTLLALFGLAKAEDMPGRVLSELLVEPPQLPLVSSYEGVVERGHDPELESVSEQAEERLRSLGYLE